MIQTSFFPQPEKDKPLEIIPVPNSIYQPRKVEEIIPNANILPDTYIIYPDGGYHPFYGVKNSFPIYQLPIWPYIKRIKFSGKWTSDETLNNMRSMHYKINHPNSQLNFDIKNRYVCARLIKNIYHQVTHYTRIKKNGKFLKVNAREVFDMGFHRLVALTWIPNPEKKKYVCHFNHDSTNYLIKNLLWGTPGENNKGKPYRSPDTLEQKYLDLINKGIIKGRKKIKNTPTSMRRAPRPMDHGPTMFRD